MPERRRITVMEAVEPDPTSYNTLMMATGQPGVPMRFTWRGTSYEVAEILADRRETEKTAESDERYVRRHVIWVETTTGERMSLSGSRGTRARAPRWTIRELEPAD